MCRNLIRVHNSMYNHRPDHDDSPSLSIVASLHPGGEWVPVRAEMVLVIVLSWCASYMVDGLRNKINGPVTRAIIFMHHEFQN